ncbi:MAG: hypothetical protein K6G44_17940 [Lentisphaeria bacterium]|nr:hypothetical protein [Lentisphaeria bacterium]
MKEYLLIILMVLATVICSVLCRQLIRSNEQIRRQIAEIEEKIEDAKKPKVIARKPQLTQNQSVATTASAGHAANAELRQEKRILEKQVAEVRKDIGTSDLASGRFGKKKRRITLAELKKLDPDAFAKHYNPENRQAVENKQREKLEQRTNFLSTMNPSFLSPEENAHLKAYVQLLNQATEMKLKGEEVPGEMFAEYRGIRQLIEKYCIAAIGSDNPSLPDVQWSLRQWSRTPAYTALSPSNPLKLKIKGEPKP